MASAYRHGEKWQSIAASRIFHRHQRCNKEIAKSINGEIKHGAGAAALIEAWRNQWHAGAYQWHHAWQHRHSVKHQQLISSNGSSSNQRQRHGMAHGAAHHGGISGMYRAAAWHRENDVIIIVIFISVAASSKPCRRAHQWRQHQAIACSALTYGSSENVAAAAIALARM